MKLTSLISLAVFHTTHSFSPIAPIPSIPSSSTKLHSTSSSSSSSSSSSTVVKLNEGLEKSVIQPGNPSRPLQFGDLATIAYNVYVPSTKKSISKSSNQKVVIGESNGVFIQGWEDGLSSMNVGEKSIIHIIDSEKFGYGTEGIPPVLGSMEQLDIEMEILDSEVQSQFGGGSVGVAGGDVSAVSGMTGSGELGALDPMKPRTPEAIAAAYASRQEQMMFEKQNEKEGLEGWIEKAKEFYFFGFFEGETGEQAPWILRPSITFPIAFAFVGLGFYITFAVGGISERGAQVTDELDDIVLSWNVMKDAIAVVALALTQN